MNLNPTLEKIEDGIYIEGPLVVGDPAYFYPDENNEWNQFCDILISEEELYGRNDNCLHGAKINVLDESFFITSTAHGDGSYPMIKHNEVVGHIPVDAGLISVMSESLYKKLSGMSGKNPVKLLCRLNIKEALLTPRKNKGDFSIGDNIKVITSYDKEELEDVELTECEDF